MRRVGLWLVTLCLMAPATSARAVEQVVSARQAAYALLSDLAAQKLPSAQERMLTHDELSRFLKRAPDPATYAREQKEWMQDLAQQFQAGVRLDEAVCADVLLLPAGAKNHIDAVMAVIHASFRYGQQPLGGPMTLTFLQVGSSWKLLLRR